MSPSGAGARRHDCRENATDFASLPAPPILADIIPRPTVPDKPPLHARVFHVSLTVTLAVLVVALLIFGAATIVNRRPRIPGEVRLIPLGAVQFLALLVAILMVAHLISLLTGVELTGRRGL
jgi:hypothetical protein